MGDRYGTSDVNETGSSILDMGYRHGIGVLDMVIYHTDMTILDIDIDMGYGLMIREMTISIWSSSIAIWDILSFWW